MSTMAMRNDRAFMAINGVVSAAALAFLGWLLLVHPSVAGNGSLLGSDVRFLPAVNASMNAISAACLCAAYVAIRRKAVVVHRTLMLSALASSAVFLVGYVVYHYAHGDTHYVGPMRGLYLALLASHVILSIFVVPLALTSFYFAFTKQLARHRAVAKITLPIWLYVSVTGVVVFFVLRASPTTH
jgi:putative membrane protein